MRIVNFQTFMRLPQGTVFAEYDPQVFGDLRIKGDNFGDRDFQYKSITDEIECPGSTERVDLLYQAEELGTEFKLDFDCWSRDGCFNDDQMFAIWDAADIAGLISTLQATIKQPTVKDVLQSLLTEEFGSIMSCTFTHNENLRLQAKARELGVELDDEIIEKYDLLPSASLAKRPTLPTCSLSRPTLPIRAILAFPQDRAEVYWIQDRSLMHVLSRPNSSHHHDTYADAAIVVSDKDGRVVLANVVIVNASTIHLRINWDEYADCQIVEGDDDEPT